MLMLAITDGLEYEMIIYPPPRSPQTETQSISLDHADFQRSDIPISSPLVETMSSPLADVHSSTPLENEESLPSASSKYLRQPSGRTETTDVGGL